MTRTPSETGFSLVELLVALGVLLAISTIVTTALMQMTQSQTTIWNRTEMHSGIRGATELLQQEVGQAGRVSVPGTTAKPGVIVLTQTVNTVGGATPAARSAHSIATQDSYSFWSLNACMTTSSPYKGRPYSQ